MSIHSKSVVLEVFSINKQWLEAFICVAKTQNVSKAADTLFLSQPSVSSRIRALENEIGEPLFLRTDKKMMLTDAGKTFIPYARNMLNEWNQSKTAVHELRTKNKGELAVGVAFHTLSTFAPHIISFARKYPDIKLIIKTGHSHEIGDLVLNYIVHAGITRTLSHKSLVAKTVIRDEFILAVYPEHRFASCKSIDFARLNAERLIFISGAIKENILSTLRSLDLDFIMETDSIEMCKEMVIKKQGIACIPRFAIEQEINQGDVIPIPFHSTSPSNIDLIYLENQANNHLLSLFTKHLLSTSTYIRA